MSVCEDSTVSVLPVQVSFPKSSLLSRYQTRRSYTKGGTFQPHWDSRYKWGEVSRLHILVYLYFLLSKPLTPFPFFGRNQTVVGVSLGASAEIHFIEPIPTDKGTYSRFAKEKRRVKVALPRRSIYIMSGDARFPWKHAIFKTGSALEPHEPPPPHWNLSNVLLPYSLPTLLLLPVLRSPCS